MRSLIFYLLFGGLAAIPPQAQSTAPDALEGLNRSIARLAETVTPSVVQVQSNSYVPAVRTRGAAAVALRSSTGSGIIVSSDGLIVTNAHVVAGATRIQIQMAILDGVAGRSVVQPRGKRLPAQVIGIDLETDLALLKVEATGLPVLELTDSEEVRQGQIVLAFGSPLGLENSVSMGVVSSAARQLEPDDRMIYLQTDAPINPGNSGGPLVDVRGNVVGVNTMIFGGRDGLGFAVPSNIVRSVVEQLRENGVFMRGEIGVGAQTITPGLATGLDLGRDHGVVLADVYRGGPAYLGGLRVGDIVLALSGKRMENARQFYVNLYGHGANQAVSLRILRGDQEVTRWVVVGVRPEGPERIARMFDKHRKLVPRLGILAVAIDDYVSRMLPALRRPNGILVTSLAVAARAPRGLFVPGDILYSINNRPLKTIDGLASVLEEYESGDSIVLQIERSGRLSYVEVQLD